MHLNDDELFALFDREVRREVEWTRMRREVFPNLVRHTLEGGVGMGGGYISWCRLTPETADTEIAQQVSHFRALGKEITWTVYNQDQPVDLVQRLENAGFKAEEPAALMVIELDDLDPSIWKMDLTHVSKLTKPEEVNEVVRLENEVWGRDLSKLGEGLKHDLVHFPELLSIYTVWQEERVVSVAWCFFLEPTSFVSLFGGSTLKEYRGRGYYRSLVAARAREARERGYRHLYVEASPDSAPILARNGFRKLSTAIDYEWKPENCA